MEFTWKKSIDIPDGKHTGEITKVTYRKEPYEYTDVWVKLSDEDVEISYGSPSVLTENSKLGRLMKNFRADYEENGKLDPEKLLIGKSVEFMTIKKKQKDGKEFSQIVEDSLKPIEVKKVTPLTE